MGAGCVVCCRCSPCRVFMPKGLVASSVMAALPIMRAPQALKAATIGASSVTGLLSASCKPVWSRFEVLRGHGPDLCAALHDC